MAISVQNLLKERKYPFAFAFTILLVCGTILLFTNTSQYPIFFYSNVQNAPSPLSSPPPANSWKPKLIPVIIPHSDDFPDLNSSVYNNFKWELCRAPLGADYIPCLDNYKAIKALISRRHMEHRERHCPSPGPRCLVPLPAGYKVPVPWPKSRDMVRLILW